jgi:hypothetical protein
VWRKFKSGNHLKTDHPIKSGLAAARACLVPGIILQCVGVLILVLYFRIPQGKAFFDAVADMQSGFSWAGDTAFKIACYLFFSAFVPLVFCFALPRLRPPRPWWRAVAFAVGFWFIMAVSVVFLYMAQARMFGMERDIWTLLKKTAFDQFVYSAFYGAPLVAVAHFWKDRGYKFSAVAEMLRSEGWFGRLIVPTLFMSWVVWIPMLFVIYSLPFPLQTHIGGLVNGFWSLISLQIAARAK